MLSNIIMRVINLHNIFLFRVMFVNIRKKNWKLFENMQFIYFLNCYCVHSCVNNNNIMMFRSPYFFFFKQINFIEI